MATSRTAFATTGMPDQERPPLPIGVAVRRTFRRRYDVRDLRADVMAGLVVGIVALPLSMALAIAVGVPPQHGLYTTIVAGAVAAIAGGSKFQVTGPTAAFVVILTPIVARYGLSGLLTAGLMAGVILVAMGLAGFGRLIQFIPYPVTTGFTAGIATVIAVLQLKDALGLPIAQMPGTFAAKVHTLWLAGGHASTTELLVTIATFALLVGIPRLTRRVPAPLVAVTLVAAAVALLSRWLPDLEVATIGSRFQTMVAGAPVHGIPSLPPSPAWPWGDGPPSVAMLRKLLPSAFVIAMLGAIESLLSAVIADGMTGKRHDPNSELVGQGLANMVAPFFGGIAATGAIARTATNIRYGARSPVAALVHAAVVLCALLLLAPLVAWVPMASLAALLLMVAWNMSEVRHAMHMLRVAPKSDVFVFGTCYVLTVAFDMVIAVSVGIVLAALLFMNRMAELTRSRLFQQDDAESSWRIPAGVALYEIAGPLFFGAAQAAMNALRAVGTDVKVVVLGLGRVPVIDATGLVALESALDQLRRDRRFVIIAGPLPEPREVFAKAQLETNLDHVLFAESIEQSLEIAHDLVRLTPDWHAGPGAAVPAQQQTAG